MDRGKQQEEKDAENEKRGRKLCTLVSAFCQRERDRRERKKDNKRQRALIVLCQRPVRPQTKATWGRQWMDASEVNSHNLQVNTGAYYALNILCPCMHKTHT